MTGAGHFYGEVFDNHRSGRPESCDRLDFLKPAGTLVVTGQKGNFMGARTQTETEANHAARSISTNPTTQLTHSLSIGP